LPSFSPPPGLLRRRAIGPRFVGSAGSNPFIYFRHLEFPELTDAMSRQLLLIDPPVYCVASNAEMGRDLLDGEPTLAGKDRLIPRMIMHESAIIAKHRNGA
jgi:hypothetical protein